MTQYGNHPPMVEIPANQDLWVFGYGSLMWRPGFDFIAQRSATLHGYHRSFCIFSHHHRGTPDTPGLVLGLDRGGSCVGCAFLVPRNAVADVVDYLNERELIGYAYTPRMLNITLFGEKNEADEIVVPSYTYVADQSHDQYAGSLPVADAASIIMNAQGRAGLNRDYLINTVRHLEQTGFAEPELHALLREVENRTGVIDIGGGI